MSEYQPKEVKHSQVPPPLFGPWGRKWIDISGLAARYKIAQGPESTPEMGKPQPTPKPTARNPGPKGSRQQTSGDLNAPENVSSSQASTPNKPGDDEGNFYIPGDPNAPSLSLEVGAQMEDKPYITDLRDWDLSDMYELHIPQEDGSEEIINTKPEEETDEDWGLDYPELGDSELDQRAFDMPTTGDEDRLQAAIRDEAIEVVREIDPKRFTKEESFVRYVVYQVEYLLTKQEEFRTTPFVEIRRLAEKYASDLWDWYRTGEV